LSIIGNQFPGERAGLTRAVKQGDEGQKA
jgi:hypothetical protein